MKFSITCFGLLCVLTAIAGGSRGDDAQASVYVVDHSAEFLGTGGACLIYHPAEPMGKEREILAIAKGPAGSTVLIIAFDRDLPYRNLAPVIAPQTVDSKPLRFPAEGVKWTYDKASPPADLYVAVFANDDPNLARLAEYVEWLGEALAQGDADTAALHCLAIKNRLSHLLRQRNAGEYRIKYGDSVADTKRIAPASKAAVTRGAKESVTDEAAREPKSPVAAVRRGLKTLEAEWREDSRSIPFDAASPGIVVFPLTTPALP